MTTHCNHDQSCDCSNSLPPKTKKSEKKNDSIYMYHLASSSCFSLAFLLAFFPWVFARRALASDNISSSNVEKRNTLIITGLSTTIGDIFFLLAREHFQVSEKSDQHIQGIFSWWLFFTLLSDHKYFLRRVFSSFLGKHNTLCSQHNTLCSQQIMNSVYKIVELVFI